MSAETLFVAIAAYRDDDCQWTVKDLFDTAADPDRVFVGICWQTIPEEDDHLFEVTTRPDQVRSVTFHATEDSQGACWARHQVQKLYRGEDYVFQIDSHCRFVEDWDQRLIDMLRACPTPRPVLTTYPVGFTPPRELGDRRLTYPTADRFHDTGVLVNGSWTTGLEEAPPTPAPTALLAAGLVFAPGAVVTEVPYDPHLYFQGEEISMAVRLWTHGWDLFVPNDCLLYHDYTEGRRDKRHWSDNRDWHALSVKAAKRVMHMLGTEESDDPDITAELDRYGLGTARTLAEYQRFAGIDFAARTISARANQGRFPMPESEPSRAELRETFTALFRDNKLGNLETRSGGGSTLGATRSLRPALKSLFADLDIRTLVDAGCGDLGWLAEVTEDLDLYLGYDIVEEAIEDNRQVWRHRRNHLFSTADITRDALPKANAVLCRDTLTHLPDAEVLEALRRFKESGIRFLIATTFTRKGDNAPIAAGQWRAIDLQAPPFDLPPPLRTIDENYPEMGKVLGVWALPHLSL